MYNNGNNFGDSAQNMAAHVGGPDPNYGMQWQGSNQMMMSSMMQPMIPGMMPGYNNYGNQNEQSFPPVMPMPPPVPAGLLSLPAMENTVPGPSHPMVMTRVNPAPNVKPPTPGPGFIGPVAPGVEGTATDSAELDAPTDNRTPAGAVANAAPDERRKAHSPGRSGGSSRDRRSKYDSARGNDGRQHDRSSGNSGSRKGDDRRRSRSRSRDRSRRDRGERRTKWDSDKEPRQHPAADSMMMTGMPGQMFPPNMFPANMEMMGQAQLEMMKGQVGIMGAPGSVGMPAGMSAGVAPGMPMNPMMGGMMMEPSMMGGMYPPQYNQTVAVSGGVLEPPYAGVLPPPRRARPPGCRTVFVGGLPDSVHEDTVREIFQRFGKISSMRLKKGFCHVRYAEPNSVEASFCLAGYRLVLKDCPEDTVSSGLLIDYALNRDDQYDSERQRSAAREPTPPRVEHISTISTVSEKIKSEDKFAEAVPTLIAWLEGGECSKKNANTFYSMIQATNNHTRRIMNDKMLFDEEFQEMKDTMKEKALKIITQLEQVVKVLNAANHKRVWDHFTKLQRKNVETWYKMSEELVTVKEEFCQTFNEDEVDNVNKKSKAQQAEEMYNEIKLENENLVFELEACKNEVYVAKNEAAREFEKFKAHFIAEQALMSAKGDPRMPTVRVAPLNKLPPPLPPPLPSDYKPQPPPELAPGEARLISAVSMFLVVHPLGASLDYIVSYARTLYPATTQAALHAMLQKHPDVFAQSITGVGANVEHRWSYVPYSREQRST